MNQAKFDCIAKLMRSRGGPSEQAARLVLLHGITSEDAAHTFDITPRAVNKLARRYRQIEKSIEAAWGVMGPETLMQFFGGRNHVIQRQEPTGRGAAEFSGKNHLG